MMEKKKEPTHYVDLFRLALSVFRLKKFIFGGRCNNPKNYRKKKNRICKVLNFSFTEFKRFLMKIKYY